MTTDTHTQTAEICCNVAACGYISGVHACAPARARALASNRSQRRNTRHTSQRPAGAGRNDTLNAALGGLGG